jgi:hypothetical protein
VGYYRSREVDGMKISITEDEYRAIIDNYGASGYEIPEDDIGECVNIDILWNAVHGF